MITLHFSYWWLFAVALVLVLFCGGDGMIKALLFLLLVVIFLATVACKVAAHFGVL
jgi:hypothetical protein